MQSLGRSERRRWPSRQCGSSRQLGCRWLRYGIDVPPATARAPTPHPLPFR